jgi:hypothetical protein
MQVEWKQFSTFTFGCISKPNIFSVLPGPSKKLLSLAFKTHLRRGLPLLRNVYADAKNETDVVNNNF